MANLGFVFNKAALAQAKDNFLANCQDDTAHCGQLRHAFNNLTGHWGWREGDNHEEKMTWAVSVVIQCHQQGLQDFGLLNVLIAMVGTAGVDALLNGDADFDDVTDFMFSPD